MTTDRPSSQALFEASIAAYAEGSWCGECSYGVVEDPPCCTQPTPANDPGLDHLLEEVAVEVLRQDHIWRPSTYAIANRSVGINLAAEYLRSVRAIDQAAESAAPCTARHDVTDDGVTAGWFCTLTEAHDEHADSIGRRWSA